MVLGQKRFLTLVGIGTVLVIALVLIAQHLLIAHTQRGIQAAAQHTEALLAQARAALTNSDTDPERRITDAAALVQQARTALEEQVVPGRMARTATALLATIAVRVDPGQLPAGMALRVRVLSDELIWLERTVPLLRRIAGYDANSDIRAARDARDVFRRMYSARDGLGKTLSELTDAPPTLSLDDVRQVKSHAQDAYELTASIIRLLDTNNGDASPLLEQYTREADLAARSASAALKRLTGEEFLRTLGN